MAENESQSQSQKKEGGRGKIIGVVIVIAVLVAVVVILASKLVNKDKTEEKKSVITAENVDEVVEEMASNNTDNIPQYYTATQNTEWSFEDGSSESSDAYVENVAKNEAPVYFDIVVDETGEEIYSSPILEQGAKLENIKLDKKLPAGDYDCTLTYHLVDEDQNELSSVSIALFIHIDK